MRLKLSYRRATIDDGPNLWRLKNDEVVRDHAIKKDVVLWNQHIKWLNRSLETPGTQIWIIENGIHFIGDVRIQGTEISIRLVKDYRGRGIGNKAIKKFATKGMVAHIVEGNIASMKVFVANGFNFIDYKDGVYTLRK